MIYVGGFMKLSEFTSTYMWQSMINVYKRDIKLFNKYISLTSIFSKLLFISYATQNSSTVTWYACSLWCWEKISTKLMLLSVSTFIYVFCYLRHVKPIKFSFTMYCAFITALMNSPQNSSLKIYFSAVEWESTDVYIE